MTGVAPGILQQQIQETGVRNTPLIQLRQKFNTNGTASPSGGFINVVDYTNTLHVAILLLADDNLNDVTLATGPFLGGVQYDYLEQYFEGYESGGAYISAYLCYWKDGTVPPGSNQSISCTLGGACQHTSFGVWTLSSVDQANPLHLTDEQHLGSRSSPALYQVTPNVTEPESVAIGGGIARDLGTFTNINPSGDWSLRDNLYDRGNSMSDHADDEIGTLSPTYGLTFYGPSVIDVGSVVMASIQGAFV
jgi:hypothetical protein